jgi:NADPH-dependent F420 reductase
MRIGMIGGTGSAGRGLAVRWARAGHEVVIGSRDGARGRATALELSQAEWTVAGGSTVDACRDSDVAVLCVPYAAHAETLELLKHTLAGKVLVDITVPLKPPAIRRVRLPPGGSAALEAQQLLGAATKVVAALHHVSAVHLSDPRRSIDCDVLVCSDDADARTRVIGLIGDLGLRGLDAGPLDNSIALESLTPVLLHLNRTYGSSGAGVRFTGIS